MPRDELTIPNPLPGEYGNIRADWYFDHLMDQAIEAAMKELMGHGLSMQQVALLYADWVMERASGTR